MDNSANTTDQSAFTHRQVSVEGVSVHVVTSGQADKPAILFLHGFPENWQALANLMVGLGDDAFHTVVR